MGDRAETRVAQGSRTRGGGATQVENGKRLQTAKRVHGAGFWGGDRDVDLNDMRRAKKQSEGYPHQRSEGVRKKPRSRTLCTPRAVHRC